MSKTIFGQGTIVTPEVANGWQNPVFVSRADFPASTTQFDLNNGEIFIPLLDPTKDLVTTETSTSKVLSPNGAGGAAFRDIWGGEITIPNAGTIGTIGIPVTIAAGNILDTSGNVVSWVETVVEIDFGQTKFLYVDNNGTIQNALALPPRTIPHTPLASLTASGTGITAFQDLRPHTFVGAHNDTPLDLVNTTTQTGDYQMTSFDRVPADTTGGSFVITAPQNPQDGDRIAFVDLLGQFSSNPIVLAPYRVAGVAQYTISDTEDDWLFSANYTYVELIFIASANTWVFEAIPDTTCKNRGTFIRCAGPVSDLVTQTTCESAGYNWISATSQCFRPDDVGVYSDGNGGNLEVPNDFRCKELPAQNEGLFLRCDGTTAVFSAGDGTSLLTSTEYSIANSPRCGGVVLGRFIECVASTASFGGLDALYEDGAGGTLRVHSDERCVENRQGRFVRCALPGEVNFGDQTVNVGIYENATGFDYLFDDARCRDIANSLETRGRFLRCDENGAGIYQNSNDGTSYRVVPGDLRCGTYDLAGDIKMSYQQTNHGPWLLCNGQSYDSNVNPEYEALRILLGFSSAGAFIVPDFQDRSPYGASVVSEAGQLTGAASAVLAETNLPPHTHTVTTTGHTHALSMDAHNHILTDPGHSHSVNIAAHTHGFNAGTHNHGFSGDEHGHVSFTAEHSHPYTVFAHAHNVTSPPHTHNMGNHTHSVDPHRHPLYVWYDTNDPFESDGNVDNLFHPGDAAIAGEVEGPNSLQFTNNEGVNFVGETGLISNGPNPNTTDGVNETTNEATTTTAGEYSNETGQRSVPVDVNPTPVTGTISSTAIGGTTDPQALATTSSPSDTGAEIFGVTTTGNIGTASEGITIANTGSGSSFSLLHPVFKINYFIHI